MRFVDSSVPSAKFNAPSFKTHIRSTTPNKFNDAPLLAFLSKPQVRSRGQLACWMMEDSIIKTTLRPRINEKRNVKNNKTLPPCFDSKHFFSCLLFRPSSWEEEVADAPFPSLISSLIASFLMNNSESVHVLWAVHTQSARTHSTVVACCCVLCVPKSWFPTDFLYIPLLERYTTLLELPNFPPYRTLRFLSVTTQESTYFSKESEYVRATKGRFVAESWNPLRQRWVCVEVGKKDSRKNIKNDWLQVLLLYVQYAYKRTLYL